MASDFSIPDWLVDRAGVDASAEPPDPAETERDSVRRYGRILSASASSSRALAGLDGQFAQDTDFAGAPHRYRAELEAIGRDQEQAFGDDRVGRNLYRRDFGRLADHAVRRFAQDTAQRETEHWARALEDRWDSLATLARGADGEGRAEILRQAAVEAHRAQSFGLVSDADTAFQGFLAKIAPAPEAGQDSERGRGPWGSRTTEYRSDRDGEPAFRTAIHRISDEPKEEMRLRSADANDEGGVSTGGASAVQDETRVAERMPQKPMTRQKPAPSPTEGPLSDGERGRMIDGLDEPEGGKSDDPVDRGGLTHYGVTAEGLADYKQRAAPNDPIARKKVSELTKADTRIIFDEQIRQYRLDRIEDSHLRQHIFDMVANHGPGIAIGMWQKALNESGVLPNGQKVEEDGILGPETRQVLNGLNPEQRRTLNNVMVDNRLRFYETIIKNDPTQEKFRNGWWKRENRFRLP